MHLLTLHDITKSYTVGEQELQVLKNINLSIDTGDFVSIMGQSWSGKSTLMNIIGMLDTPSSGNYHFQGLDVSKIVDDEQADIRRKMIWFIFQTYNLLPRMPAIKQVEMPLMYQGIWKKEREHRAIQALIKVWLADKIYSLPSELSGGQQQRVAIARAIVTDPAMLLGDEPTGALDSKTGAEVMDILSELHAEWKTIVIITHAEQIDKYAKKHIHIADGSIV